MKCIICKNDYKGNLTLKALFIAKRPLVNQCCPGCASTFKQINLEGACPCCSGKLLSGEDVCSDCMAWHAVYPDWKVKHQGFYHYNEEMGDYFQRYKFQGDIQLSQVFCSTLSEGLSKDTKAIIVPIPISKRRRKERGFNQVEELLNQSQLSYTSILKKKRGFSSQGSKKKKDRLEMTQCFYIDNKFRPLITGADVVLVDDVYTTGRTMHYAYECLMREKPNSIKSYSLAR